MLPGAKEAGPERSEKSVMGLFLYLVMSFVWPTGSGLKLGPLPADRAAMCLFVCLFP